MHLIFELYDQGNVILVDETLTVVGLLRRRADDDAGVFLAIGGTGDSPSASFVETAAPHAAQCHRPFTLSPPRSQPCRYPPAEKYNLGDVRRREVLDGEGLDAILADAKAAGKLRQVLLYNTDYGRELVEVRLHVLAPLFCSRWLCPPFCSHWVVGSSYHAGC